MSYRFAHSIDLKKSALRQVRTCTLPTLSSVNDRLVRRALDRLVTENVTAQQGSMSLLNNSQTLIQIFLKAHICWKVNI